MPTGPSLAPLAVAILICMTGVLAREQPQSLTTEQIEAAIEWGVSGEAAPYLLHHAQTPGTTNDVVVGVVYTPFVRVALASKAALVTPERSWKEVV